MGPNTRQSAAPMEMRLSAERPVTREGFEVEHGGYTKSQQRSGMRGTRLFSPPCSVLTSYSYESGPNKDKEACALIYFVPCEPGTSAIFAKFFTRRRRRKTAAEGDQGEEGGAEKKAPLTDAWREGTSTDSSSSSRDEKSRKPQQRPPPPLLSRLQSSLIARLLESSLAHVLGQSLADQDVLIMHGVYKRMMMAAASSAAAAAAKKDTSSSSSSSSSSPSSSSSSRWKSSYWLATQADVGVRAFHDWVERHGGGGPWGEALAVSSSSSSSGSLAAAAAASSPQLLTVASLAQVGLPCAAAAVLLGLTWTWLTAWKGRFYRADKLADEK